MLIDPSTWNPLNSRKITKRTSPIELFLSETSFFQRNLILHRVSVSGQVGCTLTWNRVPADAFSLTLGVEGGRSVTFRKALTNLAVLWLVCCSSPPSSMGFTRSTGTPRARSHIWRAIDCWWVEAPMRGPCRAPKGSTTSSDASERWDLVSQDQCDPLCDIFESRRSEIVRQAV